MARSKRPVQPPPKKPGQAQLEELGIDPASLQAYAQAQSMKKGGPVKKTGIYKLHKGERVVPARRRK